MRRQAVSYTHLDVYKRQGLRGAASIVFAIMVVISGVETQMDIFHIVFCIALISVAAQGSLLPLVAKKLDVVDESGDVLKTFNDYRDDAEMQLMKVDVYKRQIRTRFDRRPRLKETAPGQTGRRPDGQTARRAERSG